MISLRIFSFLAGCFALFASPLLLLGKDASLVSSPLPTLLLALLTVLVLSGVYYFFALFGRNAIRSSRLRHLGAGLIGFQLLAGAWLLSDAQEPRALVAMAPLLCFSVFLFVAFVWPGEIGRRRGQLRRRADRC